MIIVCFGNVIIHNYSYLFIRLDHEAHAPGAAHHQRAAAHGAHLHIHYRGVQWEEGAVNGGSIR